jgi:hypothetical protein
MSMLAYQGKMQVMLTDEQLEHLQWAKDFLKRFEKKYKKSPQNFKYLMEP